MTINVIPLKSADDFVSYLRPSNTEWGDDLETRWIFRGLWDGTYELVPSAWRPDRAKQIEHLVDPLTVDRLKRTGRINDSLRFDIPAMTEEQRDRLLRYVVQTAAEHEAVFQFAKMADEIGLPTLGGQDLISSSQYLLSGAGGWPDLQVTPAFGLAQHHCVPTRLLDWTTNPITAAYFAVTPTKRRKSAEIAVWAVDISESPWTTQIPGTRGDCRVELLRCPRSEHSFLHAQDGLFTYATNPSTFYVVNGRWPRLDDLVPARSIRKLTLPFAQVDALERILWKEGVRRSRFMPTYDNIARSLAVKWRLHRKRTPILP